MNAASVRRSWSSTPRPLIALWLLSGIGLAVAAALVGQTLGADPAWAPLLVEDGPIETVQTVFLAAAAGLFILAYRRSSDAKAVFCLLMSMAMVIAIQREIPVCESAFYEGGVCLTKPEKMLLVAAMGVAAFLLLLPERRSWRRFLDLRNLLWVWPVAIPFAMLVLAELAEHRMQQGAEELLELGAYVHVTAFALWISGRPAPPGP